MSPRRVAFLGNDPWSVPSLQALTADAETEVVLVITNPARPAGRGSHPTPTAVTAAARELGLDALEVERVRSGPGLDALRSVEPDVAVVVAYGALLTSEVLAIPRLGCVNVHFSLLPRWRGASPVQHALLAGDERTGVTVMAMDEGLDTGPVLASAEEPILPEDDAGSLGARLSTGGAALLVATLHALDAGAVRARPQVDGRAVTHAPKLGADDRILDWREAASPLARRVRALAPEPAAATTFRGRPLKVLAARAELPGGLPAVDAGTVLAGARSEGPAVVTGEGVLRLLEVAPAGRRRMPAADWARGARLRPSERLG